MARIAITQLGHNRRIARHSEYLAIGDAMRGLNAQHDGFTARVMAALENEPVVLAPCPKSAKPPHAVAGGRTAAAITWGSGKATRAMTSRAAGIAVQQPRRSRRSDALSRRASGLFPGRHFDPGNALHQGFPGDAAHDVSGACGCPACWLASWRYRSRPFKPPIH
jgi:negative regulator of sigma E activity